MADTPASVEEFAAHLEGRLDAIARVNSFLRRAPNACVDLEELVRSEFLAQSIPDRQLQILGPRVLLNSNVAQNLGLALHELTTNSIKFGALGHASDRVYARWHLEQRNQSRIVFNWRERVGRVLPRSDRKGFGFELIEQMLPGALDGSSSIAVNPDGLNCLFSFSVAALEPH
jgi:two-component system CheB/CheR fusion protein